MINLTKLELHNFLSHRNTLLSLSDYEGLVLIEGITTDGHYSSNGSGKSSILEGIIYALTGDTLRGVGVNDVINRNSKKNTMVSLDFLRDGIEYKVSRYRKDEIHGDSLSLYKDGENISKRLNKETQKSLEDIIGISYKILVSTMLLGEGLSSKFTQLSDPEKKSLIESTLNMSYDLSAIRNRAKNQLSELNLKRSNIEGRLSVLRELANIDKNSLESELEEKRKVDSEYLTELSNLKIELQSLQEKRDVLDKKLTLLRDSIFMYDSLESELKKIDDEWESRPYNHLSISL